MRKFIIVILILSNLIFGSILWVLLKKDRTPNFHPFKVNYHVNQKSLLKNGYTWIPEDVPLIGKTIGDTLIYFQLRDFKIFDYEYEPIEEIANTDIVIDDSVVLVQEVEFQEVEFQEVELKIKKRKLAFRQLKILAKYSMIKQTQILLAPQMLI